ncbi:MAG: carboxypeptidase regulatory-like domain-containing protein [Saprospiraceae bacterium]|nr:carboxypeptidase regulatory-like domain-containing protein [Saprospiraceae bacterium]
MKKILNILVPIFVFGLLVTGCKKDIDTIKYNPVSSIGKVINHDIAGQILDENNVPLESVEIHIGSKSTKTDANGVFSISDVEVVDQAVYVTASKAGFFKGSKLFIATEGVKDQVRIHLLAKNLAGTYNASQTGATSFESVNLSFPANAIVDANGNDYAGDVMVYGNYIDPATDGFLFEMPGDLRAFNTDNEEVVLGSFGMMAVELESPSGEKLQVKEGAKVNISMEVPSHLMAAAPSTIPLWHFDETDGFWKEEGQAVLNGNRYEGEVGHFSFWNCDAPFPVIRLDGTVVSPDGDPVPNIWIRARTSDGLESGGLVRTDGSFVGKFPKDKEITFIIISYCNEVIFEETYGPFSADAILPPFVLDPSLITAIELVNITGQIVDCNGQPVSNGYLKITEGNSWFTGYNIEADGSFDFTLSFCELNQTLSVIAYDLDTRKKSVSQVAVTTNNIDLGLLETCEDDDEYFIYTLDGDEFYVPGSNTYISPDGDITYFEAYADSLISIIFQVENNNQAGLFPINASNNRYFYVNGFVGDDVSGLEANILNFPTQSGEYIEGTMGGMFIDRNQGSHTITGTYRKKRN